MKKRVSRAATVFVVMALGIFGFQVPAWAVGVEMSGPYGTSGYYAIDYVRNALVITVRSGDLPPGKCATAYLDIDRVYGVGKPRGHYDPRIARTCKPYDSRTSSWQYEGDTYGIEFEKTENSGAVQKAAVCYGDLNTHGTCTVKVGSIDLIRQINPVSDSNNMCARWFSESRDGTQFYFGGGQSWECGS